MITTTVIVNAKQLENAIRSSINKRITSKVVQNAKDSIRDTVRYSANTVLKEYVARYAPDYATERNALNIGIDDKGRVVGGGSISSSRFMKEPQFMYLRDAILSHAKFTLKTIETDRLFNLTFSLSGSSKKQINDEIGFAWMKKVGGRKSNILERRSTLDTEAYHPTWDQLLDMWEYGGTNPSYTVKPRDVGGKLHPGPDKRISSSFVMKTIKPHRMFYLGMKNGKDKILDLVESNLKKRFKK